MYVRVHRNLHRNKFNISTYIKGVGWRLHSYADTCTLEDVTFKVNQGGRMRVIREGKKNVHAFLYGNLTDEVYFGDFFGIKKNENAQQISYNPFRNDSFGSYDTGEATFYAPKAILIEGKILACGL